MEQIALPRFLSAEWRDLLFLSYEVDPALLTPHLPPGVEPELYDGAAIASLVAFRFLNARFAGVRAPFMHSFAELNLRYYARHIESGRTGVVFIREVCPFAPVAFAARLFFNERFIVRPCSFECASEYLSFRFGSRSGGGLVSARVDGAPFIPQPGTFPHFVTSRYDGFTKSHFGATMRFEAAHRPWSLHAARLETFDLNVAEICPGELASALSGSPRSVLYSEGSPIELSWASAIETKATVRSQAWQPKHLES